MKPAIRCYPLPPAGPFVSTFLLFALVSTFLFAAASTSRSATETWHPGGATGGNGTWNTSITNWNSGVVWTNSNDAVFSGTGGTVTVATVSADSLTFSASGPYLLQSGTLTLTGSNISVGSATTISSTLKSSVGLAETGTATLTLSGSAALGSHNLTVTLGNVDIASHGGVYDESGIIRSGNVAVSGTAKWVNTGDLTIGTTGSASLLITTGATVSNSNSAIGAAIGENTGSVGSVTVSGAGSTWTDNSDLYVGDSGSGSLLITTGASVVNGDATIGATIGQNTGSVGSVTVSGTGSSWVDDTDLYIGDSGSGSLVITTGGSVINGVANIGATIGEMAGSTGSVSVSGTNSSWTDNGDLYIGDSGSGSLTITSAASVSNGETNVGAIIGNNTGSVGVVTVSGTGSTWTDSGDLAIGNSGSGTLIISNGATVQSGNVTYGGLLGGNAGATGFVTVTGSGSSWAITNNGNLAVGLIGTGSLVISNGGAVSDAEGDIGSNPGAIGTVTLSGTGSSWDNTNGLYIGGASLGAGGTGLLQITGGATLTTPETTVYGSGTLALGENPTVDCPLSVMGGTVALVDGQVQTVKLTNPVSVEAGSNFDFDIGNGSDKISLTGAGTFTVTDLSTVNLYGLSGLVTSGTDVIIGAASSADLSLGGNLSIGNVYNTGNFTYALASTSTSEEVIVTAATPLTTAYWTGAQDNIWSILVGNAASNWSTDPAGSIDPLLTPSATTDVIFSATVAANESDTLLGTNMTIKSLTISDTNAVLISGANPNPWLATNTLTISGSTGTTGITVNPGAGLVTLAANVFFSGTSQNFTIQNTAGVLVTGSLGGSYGLYVGGSSTAPGNPGLLIVGAGGTVSAARATIWDTGTVAFTGDGTLAAPLTVNAGTLALLGPQLQIVTLTSTTTIDAGSSLDLDVATGPAQIAFSGAGTLTFAGAAKVNLYALTGLVASGTDVLIAAPTSGHLSIGNVYNSGNFTYSLLSTSTSEDVVVTAAATPLTTAYWKGSQDNLWSILVGGTSTNWSTTLAGTTDPHLTPGSATDVIFSATGPTNDGDTVLASDMTIKSLTISDPNAVGISGSNANSWLPSNTLTISGTAGATGITATSAAGLVTIGANLDLTGSSQTITVNNTAGLLITGNITTGNGLLKSGAGTLTLTGIGSIDGAPVDIEAGTLAIQGGAAISDNAVGVSGEIGGAAGSNGSVSISGPTSSWANAGDLYIGNSGAGSLVVTNGGSIGNGEGFFGAVIGNALASIGTVTVSGTGSAWSDGGDLYIGKSGSGSLLVAGGGAVANGFITIGAAIGDAAGSTGSVTVTDVGSTWSDGGDLFVGNSGTGTVIVANGGNLFNSVTNIGATIGEVAGSSGSVTITGDGSTWTDTGDLFVGDSGSGTLVITGGGSLSNAQSTLGAAIGNNAGSSGAVTVSGTGSTWTNTGDLYVGNAGSGTLLISGGATVSGDNAYIGNKTGSIGSVTVTGNGSTWANSGNLIVGGAGHATLAILDGASVSALAANVSTTGTLAFGEGTTFTSPLTVSGGTVTLVDGELQTLTLTNPVTISAGSTFDFDIGAGSDQIALSGAALSISGASKVNLVGLSNVITSGTDVIIAAATSGHLSLGNVYNSGNFTYSLLSTATSEDVVVTASVTPLTTAYWKGGQDNLWNILVGATATNWSTNLAGTTDPHLTPSATTDVIFSATSPANEANTILGSDMTIKSLTISDTNAIVISGSNPYPWLPGNTLTISGTTGNTGLTVNAGAGKATVAANLFLTGSSQTLTVNNAGGLLVSGTLSAAYGIIKSGSATLTLTGSDTVQGGSTVSTGALIVRGSLSGTELATVSNGATLEVDGLLNTASSVNGILSGTGSIEAATTINTGGTFAPGYASGVTAAGKLTANADVNLTAGSTFSIRLGVVTPSDNDQLILDDGAAISLDGATLQLTIGSLNSLTNIGRKYVIIENGAGATGTDGNTFAQSSPFTTPNGFTFDIFYASDANGDGIGTGNDVVLELVAIPEPGTWSMLFGGLAVIALARRRRLVS